MTDVVSPSPRAPESSEPPAVHPPGSSGGGDEEQATVPYSRFRDLHTKLSGKLNAAEERVVSLEAENLHLLQRAATADTLARTLEEAKKGWESERGTLLEDIDLVSHGLTDEEGRAVARTLFQRLPADTRPAKLGEWLGSFKTDGAEIPKGLQGYLSAPSAAPSAAQAAPPSPSAAPAPKSETSVAPKAAMPKSPSAPAQSAGAPPPRTIESMKQAAEQFKAGKMTVEEFRRASGF